MAAGNCHYLVWVIRIGNRNNFVICISAKLKLFQFYTQILMRSTIILALILASAITVSILTVEPNKMMGNKDALTAQPQMVKNLQIANYTGSSITSDMVSTFIKLINDAYTFYPFYIQANAHYIQSKLEGSYIGKFQVLIFPENTTANLRMYESSSLVSWSKVNTAQPAWNYIIALASTDTLQNTYVDGFHIIGPGARGLQRKIQSIVSKYEIQEECQCFVNEVAADLEELNGQRWNVVCGTPSGFQGGFSGYIYQKDGIFVQTEVLPKGQAEICRYLAWVI